MISVSVTSSTIQATASATGVAAAVSSSPVTALASGGVGPQGPQGTQGQPGDSIGLSSDVQIVGLTDGDVLAYSTAANKWTNADALDGGNW